MAWRTAELSTRDRKKFPDWKVFLAEERGTVKVHDEEAVEQLADLQEQAINAGWEIYGG